jgi:hypothetical protein
LLVVGIDLRHFNAPPRLTPRLLHFAGFEERRELLEGSPHLLTALVASVWRSLESRDALRDLILNPFARRPLALAADGRVAWRDEPAPPVNLAADFARAARVCFAVRAGSDRQSRWLTRLRAAARADGVAVALIHVPLRDRFVDYVAERHLEALEACRQALRQAAAGADLLYLERGSGAGLEDAHYYDSGHLEPAGGKVYTRRLAGFLKPILERHPARPAVQAPGSR